MTADDATAGATRPVPAPGIGGAGILLLGLSLPFWAFTLWLVGPALDRTGEPALGSHWMPDFLTKTFAAPPALALSVLGFVLLVPSLNQRASLREGTGARVLAGLLFLPLAIGLVLLAGTPSAGRFAGGLLVAAVPAVVAIDALRARAWSRERALLVAGLGVLAWVWPPRLLELLDGTMPWSAAGSMLLYNAPLTLVALACLGGA
jgi:hypothetical protein